MGDNENIEIVSPTQESNVLNNCDVDLSPIIETLKDLAIKQGEIIENQNKVIKYFIPTEEEIKKQEKLKKEQEKKELEELEQQKALELEEQKEIEKKEQEMLAYNQELLSIIKDIKNNTDLGNNVSSVSTSSNFLLLTLVAFLAFIFVLYKAIRVFI